jgi:hypothetical protein
MYEIYYSQKMKETKFENYSQSCTLWCNIWFFKKKTKPNVTLQRERERESKKKGLERVLAGRPEFRQVERDRERERER